MLLQNVIEPPKTELVSLIAFVLKKSSSLRQGEDYCKLHIVTIGNFYSLPQLNVFPEALGKDEIV